MNGIQQHTQVVQKSSDLFTEEGIDIKKIFNRLFQHVWLILAVSCCTFIISTFYALTMQPMYQTNALLQIHSQNSGRGIFSNMGYKTGETSAIDTQEALIKTRYILEPAIAENNLNISTSLQYFPIIGKWIANRYHGN